MEGDAPVLTDRKEIKLWKRLKGLERVAAKGSKKNEDKLRNIIRDIIDSDGFVNPRIIVKIIQLIDLYFSDELQTYMLELLEKCELTDSVPQLVASERLVRMGAYDSAKLILDRMTVVSDVPKWEYLRGLVDVHEGNTKSAYRHFLHVYQIDDRCLRVYQELDQLEPKNGWFQRGLIASIMENESPESRSSDGEGRFGELYNVYWEWDNGGGPNALETLKRMVREGMETDIELAMARFYREDCKFAEAIEHYRNAAESGYFFIQMELARTYYDAGNYDEAMAVCRDLEEKGISERRLIELQILIATAAKDKTELIKYVKIYLYNDYADNDAYVFSIRAYIELRMHSEASSLLEKMSELEADDPVVNLLMSKNDYSIGRYASARATAKKAYRKMPEDVDCLLHISRVYMSLKRSEKALRYIDDILSIDDRNRDAHILKKDILMSKEPPDYEGACGQCEKIISYYPEDAETWRDLAILYSKMHKDQESLDAYRKSLSIKEDPKLFMEIITSLAREARYEDVVVIANEYDDVYGSSVDMWAIKGNAEYSVGKYDDAIESYTKAVEIDHNKPILWHSKGMAEEAAGEYELAEISFDKAVLMDLDNPMYWISKSAVQEKKGDYAGAINSLNRVISTHPDNVYSLMHKAVILVRLGRIGEARTFIELASKTEPLNMKIMVARRDIYYREGDTEATKAVCKNILSINPLDKKTAIILAQMHFKTGDLDEARTVLVGLDIDRDGFSDADYEIHTLLREIYHTQGKTHEEISTCKTVLSYRPDDRDTKAALAEAYIKRGMIDAAKQIYDELHLESPDDSNFSLKKAKMADDRDTALTVLMESLTSDPDNKDVLLEVSAMLYEDGNMKDALIYANRAMDADPTDPAIYVRKMEIYRALGKHRSVIATAEEALSNSKWKDPLIWKYNGDSQMLLGDYSNALISYDTAMKMGINDRDIYHSRGMCQEALEMDEAAINSYTIAYQKDPMDTDSMMRVASIYLAQEKDQSAGRVLDQAISADPNCTDAIIYRATIFASRSNEIGVKRLFDHCISYGLDEETKQIVADLMDKAKNKDVVAMPVIPLDMPYAEDEPVAAEEPEDVPAEEEEEPEQFDDFDEEPAESVNEAPAEVTAEEPADEQEDADESGFIVEEDDEGPAAEAAPEEPAQEGPEDGFVQDTGEDQIQEEPVQEQPAREVSDDEAAEEEPAEPVQEIETEEPVQEAAVQEEPVQEQSAQEVSDDAAVEEEPVQEQHGEELAIAAEPEGVGVPVAEDDDDDLVFEVEDSEEEPVTEQTVEEPVQEEIPAEEPVEERVRTLSIEDYAVRLLEYAHKGGDISTPDQAVELVGIPEDKVGDVFEYLEDIPEYGTIVPGGKDFQKMEEMSYSAIVGTDAEDIEEDPVISLTSAYFNSGANDMDTAKELVAYVYCALTSDIDLETMNEKVSSIADEVEFKGSPKNVYDIMKKYHIGVYSARAVKMLVFNEDGSVISHI